MARYCHGGQVFFTWREGGRQGDGGGRRWNEGMTTEPAPQGHRRETSSKTKKKNKNHTQQQHTVARRGSEALRPQLLHPERSEKWCNRLSLRECVSVRVCVFFLQAACFFLLFFES